MTASGGDRDGDVATAVLTDSMIFRRITVFQSGYPQVVAAMVQAASKSEIRDTHRTVYTYEYKDMLVGVLPRLAVAVGDFQTLRFLFNLRMRVEYQGDPLLHFVDVMQLAVRRKRVDMLECLAELKARDPTWQWEARLMSYAAGTSGGDLRVLEWLYAHLPQEKREVREEYMVAAIRRGNVEEIRWFVEHGYEITSYAADCAAFDERVKVLAYLYQHTRARCSARAVWQAAVNGNLEVVKVIVVEQTEEICERTLECAASSGHLQVVKYLVENGLGVTSSRAIDEAAQGGHLNVVTYLHEHIAGGCTSRAMDGAAFRGHLDIIQFLHENRCEGCTTTAMNDAAASGHLGVVKFLHENRSEGCTTNAMDDASGLGHLDVVNFLHENRFEGCTTHAMDDAAAYGHLDVVKFLHENRSEGCTTRALESAVANSHLEVVEFLCKHRSEGDISAAMVSAASAGHLEVVKVLQGYTAQRILL